jgi:hypothetical protein
MTTTKGGRKMPESGGVVVMTGSVVVEVAVVTVVDG